MRGVVRRRRERVADGTAERALQRCASSCLPSQFCASVLKNASGMPVQFDSSSKTVALHLQPNARPSAPHARQRAQQEAGHGEMDLVKTALRLTQIHHRNGVWRGGVALLAKIFYFFGGIF